MNEGELGRLTNSDGTDHIEQVPVEHDTCTSMKDRKMVTSSWCWRGIRWFFLEEKRPLSCHQQNRESNCLEYEVEDKPALHFCFLYGLQQVLLALSSTISIPLIVSDRICAGDLELVKSEIMSTFIFMCGVCTILQVLVGVRLPIIQGGCHKFIPAITALMALPLWQCPKNILPSNDTGNQTFNYTMADRTEIWQSRMREIQGGIILASITQVVVGCSGLMGVVLRYIGPITVMPTITLVGLSLIDVANRFCSAHWPIAFLTIGLVLLFSLYLSNINVSFPVWSRERGCHVFQYKLFRMLPVILAVALSWMICGILTATNVFTTDTSNLGFKARTDARIHVVSNARWFFFPYPFQWGWPTISFASYTGMMAATMTSIIESIGDYYASARISLAPPPPAHAVNRGIAMEGIGSIMSGIMGSGGATTSYSQNVGAIGFTKVASRSVFVAAGVIFIICGLFGKLGAILVTLPDPILGGIVTISFGMVTSVGISTLKFVDLSSSRNLVIIGSSILIGLMLPRYLSENPGTINTGNSELDQAIGVLLSTSMFVGGVIGFFLDNTVPGLPDERGIIAWRKEVTSSVLNDENGYEEETSRNRSSNIYDIPLVTKYLRKIKCCKYVPFCATFKFNQLQDSKNPNEVQLHMDTNE